MTLVCISKKSFYISLLILIGLFFILFSYFLLNQHTSYNSRASAPTSKKYIIGGHTSLKGDWPFMAVIYDKRLFYKENTTPWTTLTKGSLHDAFVCGGFLIDNEWVVTAAHCVSDDMSDKNNIGVILGVYDLTEQIGNNERPIVDVIEKIVHESPHTGTNTDIALLKIKNPQRNSPTIKPISFKDMDFTNPGSQVTMLGWGFTKANTFDDTAAPDILQQAETTIRSNVQTNNNLITHMIVAGDPAPTYPTPFSTGQISVYTGDSGGPLVSRINNTWYVLGVASAVNPYGGNSTYANLAIDQAWIELMTGLKGGVAE